MSHAIAPTNGVSLDEGGSSGGDFFDSGSDDDDLAGGVYIIPLIDWTRLGYCSTRMTGI